MKRLIAVLLAVSLSLIAAVGVSASENIALLDWSWGSDTSSQMSSSIPSSSFLRTPENLFNGNSGRVIQYMCGIPAESGYTYTFTNTFQLRGSYTSLNLSSGNQLSTLGYSYSVPSYTVLNKFTGKLTNALVSISNLGNGDYKLTIVYNCDKAGLTPGDIYLYANLFWFRDLSGGQTIGVSVGNEILVCMKDLDGTVFESAVLDAVNQIKEDNENYHSNALELLDKIVNAGSGYPLPDEAASTLGNSLNSLDSAEASLSSKADELRTAGSTTMSSAVAAAKDLPNKIGASTTFLATTFTSFWEAVPEEVTAVLIVCAAILFAGWLIGRIQ